MKSKILLPALLLLATAAFSQIQFAVGVKGGPNFSKLDIGSSVADTYKSRAGLHGGAFALFKFTKIGIQPEVLFSKQGSKFKVNTQNLEANFDYLNVPVILKLYLAAGINLQSGPQFGFLSNVSGKIQDANGQVISVAKGLYKDSDLSWVFGIGWDLPFGLMAEARYNLGLQKIQDNPALDATKNQVIQVSLGYKLIKLGN
ncbi:MAG: porin family protein [Bacteroidota bacterium]